jgi:hypothetical protein
LRRRVAEINGLCTYLKLRSLNSCSSVIRRALACLVWLGRNCVCTCKNTQPNVRQYCTESPNSLRSLQNGQGRRLSHLQTHPDGLWGPPSVYPKGHRGSFLWAKRAERTLTTHLHSAEDENEWSCTSSPLLRLYST